MVFEDAEQGNSIYVIVKEENRQTTLESRIINIVDGKIMANPFMVNDAIVQFPKSLVTELLIIREADVPLYFQRVYIEQQKYHESTCHMIYTNLPGIKYNRRSSFRVPLTAPIKINIDGKTINATLKDLSNSSFSLLLDKSRDLELHKKFSVEFCDQAQQRYFEFYGRPVRKAELDSYNLFGCIMEKRLSELDNYLAQKQVETRRNRPS